MERNDLIFLIKKLNILKFQLLSKEENISEILEIIMDLQNTTNLETTISKIQSAVSENDSIKALNLLNYIKDQTIKKIFANPCPKNYYDLINTEDFSIKYCPDCRKNVYLVSNEKELQRRKKLEQCVAINLAEFSKDTDERYYRACHLRFEEETMGLPF